MDWLDPELWKKPAETFGYWQTIFGAAGSIGLSVLAFLRWGLAPFRRLASKIWSNKKQPVERPLRFVPNERQALWTTGSVGSRQVTQVHGHWHVTNVSNRNVVLLQVRLANYEAEYSRVATKGPNPETGSPTFDNRNPIIAGRMSEVIAHFTFSPPICDGHEPLVADVIFTDNYEDEQRFHHHLGHAGFNQ
jgi:hypothetical protein